MLSDVPQSLADDPDHGALDERLELPLGAGLLEVHGNPALPAKVVRKARDGHRQVQAAGIFGLTERRHVLPHVRERRARVAGRLRQLRSKRAGIAVERALATLEREHHAGELLRDTIVELLRDAPPFVRGRSLNEVGGCRLLQHPREVLAKRRDEVGLGRRVRRRGAPEDEDAQHHATVRDHDAATVLSGAHLEPVGSAIDEGGLREPDATGRNHPPADGGGPRSVGSDEGLAHPGRLPTTTRVTLRGPPFVLLTSRSPPCRYTGITMRAWSGSTSINSQPPGRSQAHDSPTARRTNPRPSSLWSVSVCTGSHALISSGRSSTSPRGT